MKVLKSSFLSLGAAALMFVACAGNQQAPVLTVSGLDPAKFDTTLQNKPVKLFTLKNANGMEVCITNYGGRVVSLVVPDRTVSLRTLFSVSTTLPSMLIPSTPPLTTVPV